MIVSGGKILGIHKVEHDITFSGDGVRTPLGLDHELLEEIHETSAKLEKSEFDSWSAQTEHWDVSKYTGVDGIKVDDHEISVSAKYLTSGDLNPYATSSWVEDNFLNKADYREYSEGNDYVRIDDHKIYGYDWTSAVSGVPFKVDTSAFEQYSAWANGTYLKEEALKPYVTSSDLEPYAKTQWTQEALDKKQDVSAMSAYATSAWVDGNFQPKGNYITPAELETALEPYATSDRVNEGLAKKVDVTSMSAYATSAWVEENFSKETVRVSYDAQSEELSLDFYSHTNEVLIGGRWYQYVQIGNQLWLVDNLDYQWDGLIVGGSETSTLEQRANYFNDDPSTYGVNGNKYGLLYNWVAVKYLNDNKGTLLPSGWHVPSRDESDTLISFVGGSSTAGLKLKSTTVWNSGYEGTNDYGFTAYPAGYRHHLGDYVNLGTETRFWNSTSTSYPEYQFFYLINSDQSYNSATSIDYQFSIRLVKDIT